MNRGTVKQWYGMLKGSVRLYSPAAFSAFAVVTSVGATIMSALAMKEAQKRIEDAATVEEIRNDDGEIEMVYTPASKKEKAAIYVDEFIPVITVEFLAGFGIYKSWKVSNDRIIGLTAQVATQAATIKRLEEDIEKVAGKEKAEEMKAERNQEGVDEKLEELGDLPAGTYLWKDPHYKFTFTSTETNMLRAVNAANSIFECEGHVTPGIVYFFAEKKAPAAAELEGWTWDQIANDWGEVKIPITWSLKKTKAGAQYVEIEYNSEIRPIYDLEDMEL